MTKQPARLMAYAFTYLVYLPKTLHSHVKMIYLFLTLHYRSHWGGDFQLEKKNEMSTNFSESFIFLIFTFLGILEYVFVMVSVLFRLGVFLIWVLPKSLQWLFCILYWDMVIVTIPKPDTFSIHATYKICAKYLLISLFARRLEIWALVLRN